MQFNCLMQHYSAKNTVIADMQGSFSSMKVNPTHFSAAVSTQ